MHPKRNLSPEKLNIKEFRSMMRINTSYNSLLNENSNLICLTQHVHLKYPFVCLCQVPPIFLSNSGSLRRRINPATFILQVCNRGAFREQASNDPSRKYTIFEPRNPSLHEFYVAQKRWSADLEALKLGNVRSGRQDVTFYFEQG